MSKSFAVICLPLGLFLAFPGCGIVESPSSPRMRGIPEPIQPIVADQDRAPDEAAEPGVPTAELVSREDETAAGPNAQVPAAKTPAMQAVETVPPEPAVADVPNQAEAKESRTPHVIETAPAVSKERTANAVLPEGSPSDPNVLVSFYRGYGEILQEYVREDGRVDYESLRRKRLRLKHLLGEPGELDPQIYQKWPEEEKLAFWINTYNLKMLEIIARNYPIQSSWWLRLTWPPSDIRHINAIWSNYRFIVMDEEFTLSEVERRHFRKTFGDPRAYLAITYAARSGPTLRRKPYRGKDLSAQLDEQIKAFLSSDQGFRIDRENAVVYLSALFKPSFRGKEFVGHYAMQKKFKDRPAETRAVLNFLTQYISREDIYYLEVENYTLAYMNFDWRLNDSGRGY